MTDSHPSPAPRKLTVVANRYAGRVRISAVVLILVSLGLLLRRVPMGAALDEVQTALSGLGFWGVLVFALLYVAVSLLLLPASALTLGAGAFFGLLLGTVVVSVASTTAAALAFGIARQLARERLVRRFRRDPRFDAIDRAVRDGGWRIVALLRLSPAVPFTLQNYLYGLTAIRFVPYVLTSWLAMLPGTFLYVYLGTVGRAGLESARGSQSRTPAEWTLLGVGLLATLGVTIYITRLARHALRKSATKLETVPRSAAEVVEPQRWPWGTTLLVVLALAVFTAAML